MWWHGDKRQWDAESTIEQLNDGNRYKSHQHWCANDKCRGHFERQPIVHTIGMVQITGTLPQLHTAAANYLLLRRQHAEKRCRTVHEQNRRAAIRSEKPKMSSLQQTHRFDARSHGSAERKSQRFRFHLILFEHLFIPTLLPFGTIHLSLGETS